MYHTNKSSKQPFLTGIIDLAYDYLIKEIPLNRLSGGRICFENILKIALLLSLKDPSKREQIGIFWIDDIVMATNTRRLSKTLGIKLNSINADFRQHGLVRAGKVPAKEIGNFKDPRYWRAIKDKMECFTKTIVSNNFRKLLQWDKPKSRILKELRKNEKLESFNQDSLLLENTMFDLFSTEKTELNQIKTINLNDFLNLSDFKFDEFDYENFSDSEEFLAFHDYLK